MRKLYITLFLFSFLCRVSGLAQTEVKAYTMTFSGDGLKTVVKEIPLPANRLTPPTPPANVAGTAIESTAASSSFCAADITVDNDAGTCGAAVTYTAPAYTPPICDQTLTQTAANTIDGAASISARGCETSYLRAFDLLAMGYANGFTVSSVDFGVGHIFDPSVSGVPLTVNVYRWDPSTPLVYSNFTLVGSEDLTLPNDATRRLESQTIRAVIPPGFGMIVEIRTGTDGANFGIGTTASSQLAPTYYSISCNADQPLQQQAGARYVINANGCAGGQTIKQTVGLASGSLFPLGTTTNTFESGGITVCSFTVTVADIEKPVLTSPVIPVQCYQPAGTYAIAPLQVGDNCGIASTSYAITGATTRSGTGTNAGGAFNLGTSTITWMVTDVNGNHQTGETTVTVGSALTATIPDAKAMSRGVALNTVYLGYAPAGCLTLSAQVSGGSGVYQYKWSTGATTASIQVCPTVTTTYGVTVTDAQGCTQTAARQVQVVDVRCGTKNDKVALCHKDAKGGSSTVCVKKADVNSHLLHGDYLGGCSGAGAPSRVASQDSRPGQEGDSDGLTVQVLGNPAPDHFTLVTRTHSTQPLALRVMDAAGRLIETRQHVPAERPIQLGEGYRSGIYFVEITQGPQRATLKLLKSH